MKRIRKTSPKEMNLEYLFDKDDMKSVGRSKKKENLSKEELFGLLSKSEIMKLIPKEKLQELISKKKKEKSQNPISEKKLQKLISEKKEEQVKVNEQEEKFRKLTLEKEQKVGIKQTIKALKGYAKSYKISEMNKKVPLVQLQKNKKSYNEPYK